MNKSSTLAWPVLCILLVCEPLQAQVAGQSTPTIIDVSERRDDRIQFGSNAVSRIAIADVGGNPGSLVEFIDRAPGIVKSGQNGLLQGFSIRGVAGQRVQTRFNGVPITSERRAGTGAAFVDPWFLDSVAIVKGPASAYFGSGAIGGVVLMEPRFFTGVEVDLGYESDSAQRVQSIGFGNKAWSAGLSHREAADGENPLGEPLHSGYTHTSAVIGNKSQIGEWNIDSVLLTSRGSNIGRSNSLYPQARIGGISTEDHDLIRIGLTTATGGKAGFYLHDQYTRSETDIIGSNFNRVDSSSLDWGLSWNQSWQGRFLSGEIGAEFDRRERVHAEEIEYDRTGRGLSFVSNLDADQRATSVYATASLNLAKHQFKAGVRQSWEQQRAKSFDKEADVITTGFAGWQWYALEYWSVSAEIASAYRSATLTERYYSGATGRGNNIGNPELKNEEIPGVDLGLYWQRGGHAFTAHWFQTSLDDYIERTIVDADTRSFGNRRHGKITGMEVESAAAINERLSLLIGLHWLEGKGSGGVEIADIPASEFRLGMHYAGAEWNLRMHWRYRQANSRFAETEQPVDSASTIDVDYEYQLSTQATLSVYINNSLDDVYLISADELSTLGAKRSIGLRLNYRFTPARS